MPKVLVSASVERLFSNEPKRIDLSDEHFENLVILSAKLLKSSIYKSFCYLQLHTSTYKYLQAELAKHLAKVLKYKYKY